MAITLVPFPLRWKYSRLVVVHEGWTCGGFGGGIAASATEAAFDWPTRPSPGSARRRPSFGRHARCPWRAVGDPPDDGRHSTHAPTLATHWADARLRTWADVAATAPAGGGSLALGVASRCQAAQPQIPTRQGLPRARRLGRRPRCRPAPSRSVTSSIRCRSAPMTTAVHAIDCTRQPGWSRRRSITATRPAASPPTGARPRARALHPTEQKVSAAVVV